MIYFVEAELPTRWKAVEYRVNPITGERSTIEHARVHEVESDVEYTIYWKAVSVGTRKMTTFHKGNLSGAQVKVLKARLYLTE